MKQPHGLIQMDDALMRRLVADHMAQKHSNMEFIRQLADGEQDDGPFMVGARVVRDWFASQMAPAPEMIDE